MTKIFCDIADKKLIKIFNKKNIVKGFTTNPSLMRKAGAKDYQSYSYEIIKITKKPVSFEVFADDENNMISQGKKINKWGKNVYVKVPVCNSKGKFMGKVIKKLNQKKSLFQNRLSKSIRTSRIPKIKFEYDNSSEFQKQIDDLINQISTE